MREAVEALDSGFALYDENQRLVLHNRHFLDLNPGIADLIRLGAHRDDLLAAMKARGLLLIPDRAIESKTPDGLTPINTLVSQASGALYNIRFNPTASGDWVTLVTDVTEIVQDQKKLRAMFEVSADAMFDFDVAKGTITFDSGFKTQFGFDYHGEHDLLTPPVRACAARNHRPTDKPASGPLVTEGRPVVSGKRAFKPGHQRPRCNA